STKAAGDMARRSKDPELSAMAQGVRGIGCLLRWNAVEIGLLPRLASAGGPPAGAAALAPGRRCNGSTAGLGGKCGHLPHKRPALIIGILNRLVGVGHGAEELNQGSVGFGDVFVKGHGGMVLTTEAQRAHAVEPQPKNQDSKARSRSLR